LFLAIVLIFPLQYWFASSVTEPYPALKLPAFRGARLHEDTGEFVMRYPESTFHFSDGTTELVSLRKLINHVASSQIHAMAETALRPKPGGPPPKNPWRASDWKRHLPWKLFPGYLIKKRRQSYWNGVEPPTLVWLQRRARELFPDKRTEKVDVKWYREMVHWDNGRVTREKHLTDSLEIPL
jgi:hypothetical protein